MSAFANTMGIDEIEFKMKTRNFCPLGQDYYTNQLAVSILVGEIVPDYCVVQKDINEQVNQKELSIEDAVAKVGEIISEYEPLAAVIESYADDAVHFPVKVKKLIKQGGKRK